MGAADAVLLGRFHERFADHAVEIAQRVFFQATGAQLGAQPVGLSKPSAPADPGSVAAVDALETSAETAVHATWDVSVSACGLRQGMAPARRAAAS